MQANFLKDKSDIENAGSKMLEIEPPVQTESLLPDPLDSDASEEDNMKLGNLQSKPQNLVPPQQHTPVTYPTPQLMHPAPYVQPFCSRYPYPPFPSYALPYAYIAFSHFHAPAPTRVPLATMPANMMQIKRTRTVVQSLYTSCFESIIFHFKETMTHKSGVAADASGQRLAE